MLDVFVQVNMFGEVSKYGLDLIVVVDFVQQLFVFLYLCVCGLMILVVFFFDFVQVCFCFVCLCELCDCLLLQFLVGVSLDVLLMGMFGDVEIVIEEGVMVVCVGQVIFGVCSILDSFYWFVFVVVGFVL